MAEPDPTWGDVPDLDEFLQGEEPPWEDDPTIGYTLSAQRADQLLRRLGALEAAGRRDALRAEEQRAQIDGWLEARDLSRARQLEWLRSALQAYAAGIFSRSGTATIKLPSGELTSRKLPDEWKIEDEVFLAWAKEHMPLAVRQKPAPAPEVDRDAAKKLLARLREETGELPPGVTFEPHGPADRKYTPKPRTGDFPE